MGKRDGRQKGPQQHAEGQHGKKTHSKFIENLHIQRGTDESDGAPQRDAHRSGAPVEGGHRIFEMREQNDPADRASEKNRIERELRERGEHSGSDPRTRGGE